jgi:hypothetical protein
MQVERRIPTSGSAEWKVKVSCQSSASGSSALEFLAGPRVGFGKRCVVALVASKSSGVALVHSPQSMLRRMFQKSRRAVRARVFASIAGRFATPKAGRRVAFSPNLAFHRSSPASEYRVKIPSRLH